MERDKLIKIIIAAVIGVAAIVLLAVNFLGGPKQPPTGEGATPEIPPAERTGGGRLGPGGDRE